MILKPTIGFNLNSYNDFVDICNKLDTQMSTTTYICEITLKQICELFLNICHKNELNSLVDEIFSNTDTIYSDDTNVNKTKLIKLNAFYEILPSLNKIGIKHPISLSYFKNKNWGIHPGSTRLFFENYYFKTVTAMVTDYTNNIVNHYPDIKFVKPSDYSFDVNGLNMVYDDTSNGRPNKIRIPSGKDYIVYKELSSTPKKELADPSLYNPPRCYQLKNDKVFVCGELILVKIDDEWKFHGDTIT